MTPFLRLIALIAAATVGTSAEQAAPPAIVSHVLVLSQHIEDVSSLDAWRKSMIGDGLTDEQQAKRVWETVVKFRHQSLPPDELLIQDGVHAHDFIKMAHVYGWGQCCCASSHVEQLARHIGLPARGWGLNNHSVPEIQYDGRWHMFDASLVNWYVLDDGKTVAGVEELMADPQGRVNQKTSPFVNDRGWYPANTHQVQNSPASYVKPAEGRGPFLFDYGYSQGYELNVQLREGERLVRNWSNKGMHPNQAEGGEAWHIAAKVGEGDLAYAPKYGDIAPGRIGNGTHTYEPSLGTRGFIASTLSAQNVATTEHDRKKPALHIVADAKPASVVIRMPSSYLYLGGSLDLGAVVGKGGAVKVSFSDNNGLDWREIADISASGAQTIDLKPLCHRRYDYRLKFDLSGAGTGLDRLAVSHDVLHSQRPLPALKQGANAITFSAGAQEGRITIEGSVDPGVKPRQLVYTDFHPVVENLAGAPLFMNAGTGSITYPITTPGDLTRIEMGGAYRARGVGEGFDYQVSWDDGKSWATFGRAEGPCAGSSHYATLRDVPKGTRSALVRYLGNQNNTLGFFHMAINAHYAEPAGGFRPVKVTYRWDENGQEKEDVHVAQKAGETYSITCASAPTMKSLTVELAP